MKKVLLVGDIVNHGKIALSAMIPILSSQKISVSNLPTCLVSNTFDYEKASVVDLTDHMEETIKIWKELGFYFDIIVTGFLVSMRQVDLISEIIAYHDKKPFIITDPIMGDDGTLYHGVSDDVIHYMRRMIEKSDLIIPNVTESSLLLGRDTRKVDRLEIENQLSMLSDDKRAVIITSADFGGKPYISCQDNKGKISHIAYERLDYKFAGTGDLFSSLIVAKLVKGLSLEDACKASSQIITRILKEEVKKKAGKVREVEIEEYLDTI